MRLEEILKKEGLSSFEISEMLYYINNKKQNDEKKINLYNKALFEASKLGIEVLEKIKNDIGNYNLTEEEKAILQRNVTFYINEQKNAISTNENSASRHK